MAEPTLPPVEIRIVKWKELKGLSRIPRPRHGHRSVPLKKYLVSFGGGSGNDGVISSTLVFDTVTNTWFVPRFRGRVHPLGVAAFGMCADENSQIIYIYGGIKKDGSFSDELYELQAKCWEWNQLKPKGSELPGPRLGHSFTFASSSKTCFLFGGIAASSSSVQSNKPEFKNDLYALNFESDSLKWMIPKVFGMPPSPRESHTASYYSKKDQILIYGGMNGQRLGDLWILDLNSMTWLNPLLYGVPPEPRSLHTADIINDRLYIFGGWIPSSQSDEKAWKCTNSLAMLNIDKSTWSQLEYPETQEREIPAPRGGHCSVAINKRLYVWSGRNDYNVDENGNVLCFEDLFFLETSLPPPPTSINLVRSTPTSLQFNWPSISSADLYGLQINLCSELPALSRLRRLVSQSSVGNQREPQQKASPVAGTDASGKQMTVLAIKMSRNSSVSTLPQNQEINPPFVATPLNHSSEDSPFSLVLDGSSTTYSIPSASSFDSSMPQNILDEAFNDAESFVESHKRNLTAPSVPSFDNTSIINTQYEAFVKMNGAKVSEIGHNMLPKVENLSDEKPDVFENKSIEMCKPEFQQNTKIASNDEVAELSEFLSFANSKKPNDSQTSIEQQQNDTGASNLSALAHDLNQVVNTFTFNTPPTQCSIAVKLNTGHHQADSSTHLVSLNPDQGNQTQNVCSSTVKSDESNEKWFDVGRVEGTECTITHFYEPMHMVDQHGRSMIRKIALQPDTQYKVRIASVNGCGEGPFSPTFTYKTIQLGLPSAPTSIKISRMNGGAQISWEPPPNGETVQEYTVYLAVRPINQQQQPNIAATYVPIYIGSENWCFVGPSNLYAAYIDLSMDQPAVIFRIAVKNSKGYGLATQVRWLQPEHNQSSLSSGQHRALPPQRRLYQTASLSPQHYPVRTTQSRPRQTDQSVSSVAKITTLKRL